MPRASVESKSAALWRSGSKHPAPPKTLSREAKAIWKEIVLARPADFFAPGALHLLEQFCVATVAARQVARSIEIDPTADTDIYAKYMTLCAGHAQKLRLSIQSALRTESGKNDEREAEAEKKTALLGGRHLRVA
jgi:hypothetical protein